MRNVGLVTDCLYKWWAFSFSRTWSVGGWFYLWDLAQNHGSIMKRAEKGRVRHMSERKFDYKINDFIVMVAFTIIFAFTVYCHFSEIVVTVYLGVSQQSKVNAWLSDSHVYSYSTCGRGYLWRGFCEPTRALCIWVVLFRTICKYDIVWHTPSTWTAWPLGPILRAVYSYDKPIPVANGKRFVLRVR